jgi:hypothetical protein
MIEQVGKVEDFADGASLARLTRSDNSEGGPGTCVANRGRMTVAYAPRLPKRPLISSAADRAASAVFE